MPNTLLPYWISTEFFSGDYTDSCDLYVFGAQGVSYLQTSVSMGFDSYDFVIDFWVYLNDFSFHPILSSSPKWGFAIVNGEVRAYYTMVSGSSYVFRCSQDLFGKIALIEPFVWTHIVLVQHRSTNRLHYYKDGNYIGYVSSEPALIPTFYLSGGLPVNKKVGIVVSSNKAFMSAGLSPEPPSRPFNTIYVSAGLSVNRIWGAGSGSTRTNFLSGGLLVDAGEPKITGPPGQPLGDIVDGGNVMIGCYNPYHAEYLKGQLSKLRVAIDELYSDSDVLESYNQGRGKLYNELNCKSKLDLAWDLNEGDNEVALEQARTDALGDGQVQGIILSSTRTLSLPCYIKGFMSGPMFYTTSLYTHGF